MDVGKMLHDRREELGYTLDQVGAHCGVGKSTVRKWETGMIRNMRRDKIALLAEILRLDPLDIIADEAPAPAPALTDLEIRLLAAFRGADETIRGVAMELLESHQKREG